MDDTSYQMYSTYMPSPDGSSINRRSETSFSSQQPLLTSPEPIQGGWTPTPHQGHYSFPQPQDGAGYQRPVPFDTSRSSAGGGYRARYQLLHLLWKSTLRWLITVGLCALFAFTMSYYGKKDIMDETQKRLFNTWTVALSIMMSLNVASSFKEMAMNIRWWLLSWSKYNLPQLDLILRCESMQSLAKLLFKVRTPVVFFFCVVWLLLNIITQVGIAMMSLTYGIEVDPETALSFPGNVSTTDMGAFYTSYNVSNAGTISDQEFLAHTYAIATLSYSSVDTSGYVPPVGRTWSSSNVSIWLPDPNTWTFAFLDSPPSGIGPSSVFSNRTISSTWSCDAQPIISDGNGTKTQFPVRNLGLHNVSLALPNATIFYTNYGSNACKDPSNKRCAVVQAFEASDTDPWYYSCEITISEVSNNQAIPAQDVSDQMASIAASAIALQGYQLDVPDSPDSPKQELQIYPSDTFWGSPMSGSRYDMGQFIALFSIGSLLGAALSNPPTFYNGMQPTEGQHLIFNHPTYFYLIVGLLCGGQLVLLVAVSVLADRVAVLPESYIAAAALLRPVAQRMEADAGPYRKKKWKTVGKQVQTRYIEDRDLGWKLQDV